MITKPSYLLPMLALMSLLSACATPTPAPQPIPVKCPRPVIDKDLVRPADRAAMMRLQALLEMQPPSASPMPTGSTR